nr:unnamed protein product [Callosobruchus analis]CAI5835674.1 unnamed protein product [Callosobruchus analis]
MAEFETWFKHEQKSTVTNFYLKTTLKGQTHDTSYFYCNRSGQIHTWQDIPKKRSTKSQGSCKINKFCTSQIILKKKYPDKEMQHTIFLQTLWT